MHFYLLLPPYTYYLAKQDFLMYGANKYDTNTEYINYNFILYNILYISHMVLYPTHI